MTTSELRQVKIGPSFFAQAFKDYSNWQTAWVREILQNCQDSAGCTQIDVRIEDSGFGVSNPYGVYVTVSNNGEPMTEQILLEKFLALGESGKSLSNGSVGGFGKAKELLVFCHDSWSIHTGELYAAGRGGEYTLTKTFMTLGTTTTVTMSNQVSNISLENAFKAYAKEANWNGELRVNGEVLTTDFGANAELKREFEFGKAYSVDTEANRANRMLVRVKGIPMFGRWIDYPTGVIILELNNSTFLTSNRDGFTWSTACEVTGFIEDISTNRAKAFADKDKVKEKKRFKGFKLKGTLVEYPTHKPMKINLEQVSREGVMDYTNIFKQLIAATPFLKQGEDGSDSAALKPDFFLKSEIDEEIPVQFLPGTFSKRTQRLFSNWVNILVELATLLKIDKSFSIGFIFSRSAIAQYEYQPSVGHVIYINPATDLFTDRWTKDKDWDLLASAAHEMVHLMGYERHNESYASQLTDVMALVLANRPKFSKLFKTVTTWSDDNGV